MRAVTFFLFGVICVSGCATTGMHSTHLGATRTQTQPGLTYYLPMRYARVTFDRSLANSEADKLLVAAEAGKLAAASTTKAAEAARNAQKKYVEALGSALPAAGSAAPELSAAVAKLVELTLAHEAAVAAGIAADKKVAAAAEEAAKWKQRNSCGYVDSFKVELLDYVPDVTQRYVWTPRPSAFRNDKYKFTTTPSGLLTSVDATQKDQTVDVLVALAKSLSSVGIGPRVNMMTPKLLYGGIKETPHDLCAGWHAITSTVILDPINASEWENFGKLIPAPRSPSLPLTHPNIDGYRFRLLDPGSASGPVAAYGGTDGLRYRRERPVSITIHGGGSALASFQLMVPNGAPADAIDIGLARYGDNVTTYKFSNGMLIDVDATRPSSALAVAGIPFKITDAVVQQLSSLLTARVEISTSRNSLTENDVTYLKKLKELSDAQTALDTSDDPP